MVAVGRDELYNYDDLTEELWDSLYYEIDSIPSHNETKYRDSLGTFVKLEITYFDENSVE